jgi:hypothetical protein
LQQPLVQELVLQMHIPLEHVVPGAHVMQLAPPVPQVGSLDVSHWPLELQHPLGHEVALHTQALPLQACPGEHGPQTEPATPAVPHWETVSLVTHEVPLQHPEHEDVLQTHCPLAPHACPLTHVMQLAPPVPQVVLLDVSHCPLELQHPSGHEWASQTHAPCALHSCPGSQSVHTPPFAPHAVFDTVTHTPSLEQQPLQLVPPQVHDPLLQAWSVAQTPHALPSEPQALVDCAEDVVHSHAPEAPQAWPLAQAVHAAPPVPHVPIPWLEYAMHVPLSSQHPVGHDAASQTHFPERPHACPCAHATHAPPLAPHAALVGVTHCPTALQQPEAQESLLHAHTPGPVHA